MVHSLNADMCETCDCVEEQPCRVYTERCSIVETWFHHNYGVRGMLVKISDNANCSWDLCNVGLVFNIEPIVCSFIHQEMCKKMNTFHFSSF